jgi:hypothetical protein
MQNPKMEMAKTVFSFQGFNMPEIISENGVEMQSRNARRGFSGSRRLSVKEAGGVSHTKLTKVILSEAKNLH